MAIVRRAIVSTLLVLSGIGLVSSAQAADTVRTANMPFHAAPSAADTAMQPTIATDTNTAALSPAIFTTLAAAVAAQPSPDATDDELSCLAGAVYFESHGEPLLGQLAVAKVVLNRTRSGRYPTSICGVVTQRSQFSFVRGGVVPTPPEGGAYRTALAIAEIAMSDQWADPSEGALAFHARRVSPGWAMRQVAAIGNHIFYR